MAAVMAEPRPFDVLVLMDASRLGRDIAETSPLQLRIIGTGCAIWHYQDGQELKLDTPTQKWGRICSAVWWRVNDCHSASICEGKSEEVFFLLSGVQIWSPLPSRHLPPYDRITISPELERTAGSFNG